MENILDRLKAVREGLEPDLARLASDQAQRLAGMAADDREIREDALQGTADACRHELLDGLLSLDVLRKIDALGRFGGLDVAATAGYLRRRALPLSIPLPDPEMMVRPSSLALSAGLGALAGLFTLKPLT